MTVDISESFPTGVDIDSIGRFARSVLDHEGVAADASLSVALVDEARIAELNREHMGKDGPTDVLSFPIEEASPGVVPVALKGGPPLQLGDIFVSTDVVARHAQQFDSDFDTELHLMICHGVLHILGWDHQTDAEAELMEAREATHLARMGMSRR
ncbi:MAG: rRNA maturation RNase YbeY [Acidimicrobiia bacterium]